MTKGWQPQSRRLWGWWGEVIPKLRLRLPPNHKQTIRLPEAFEGVRIMKKTTFGVIVGNRASFPDVLAKQGRKDILDVLKKNGFNSVALATKETKYGTVETFDDAKKCAALFAQNASKIDGIIDTRSVPIMLYGHSNIAWVSKHMDNMLPVPCRDIRLPCGWHKYFNVPFIDGTQMQLANCVPSFSIKTFF